MKKFFNGIRWIIVAFLIIPTFIILVGNGVLASFGFTVTNSENPKHWLREGNVYENSVQFAINGAIERTINNPETDSPFEGLITEQEIRDTANAIFTPEWIQGQVEPLIDSVYAFLNKETDELEFEINLSAINQNAQTEVLSLMEEKLNTAEDCSGGQTSGCIPSEINRDLLLQKVQERMQRGILPTDKQVLTHNDLNIRSGEFDRIREGFSFAKMLPWFVYGGILIITLLIALLSPRSYNSFRVPGYLWMSAGIITLILSFVGKLGFSNLFTDFVTDKIPPERTDILELVQPPVEVAFSNFTNYILLVSLVVILLGYLSVRHSKKKK